jgi:UDP:flavonoid glycosyltransferase YjiC (YdhE family)
VFFYTHRFPARDWLIEELTRRGLPTVAYTHDLPRATAEKLAGPTMRLSMVPLDCRQAAAECDIAILNSGHNSAAQFLMAGKPLLLLPISLEQGLLMRRLVEQGLALAAPPDRPQTIAAGIDGLLTNSRFRDAARAFAAKYVSYDPDAAQDAIIDSIEERIRPSISV